MSSILRAHFGDQLGADCEGVSQGFGAIVGGAVVVDRRPRPIIIEILIYRAQDSTAVFATEGDPRSFRACGLSPGIYTLKLDYPPSDMFLVGNVQVMPLLAARVVFTVADR